MEADKELINTLDKLDIFKPEYAGQKIKNNINFIKYRESILKKYGKNARIFYCKENKIYFYYNDSEYPYEGICPLCSKSICYFCLTFNWFKVCCLRSRMYYLLTDEAMIFLNDNAKKDKFKDYLIYALFPYLNSLVFFGGLHIYIYKWKTNVKTIGYNGKEDFLRFEDYLKGDELHLNIFILIAGFDIFTVIFLSIPFLFLDIFFTILLILISIPFKFYPLKYLFGIGFIGMEEVMFI